MRGTRKDFETPSRETVQALVRAFLDAPRRESGRGGFAEVPEGDKTELDALLRALVKYRYEPDSDGDRPIRWSLVDWTREEPVRACALPKGHDPKARLRIAQLNVSLAADDLRGVVQEMLFEEEGDPE